MPQLQLPIFPAGVTEINDRIAVQKEGGRVCYIHGHLPVFQHEEQDVQSFRMFTSHSSASVLKGAVVEKAQRLLEEGRSMPEVSAELNILTNTLHKAVRAGRLRATQKKTRRRQTQ